MANPQPDKFVRVSNELWDAYCRIRIPGEPRQVLDVIIRKTYGYHKKEDRIPLSQFVLATGTKKPNIIRSINTLLSMNLIIKTDTPRGNMYKVNKDFDTWKPLSKAIPPVSKVITSVIKSDNALVSKAIPSKDTSSKDTISKDKYIASYEAIITHLNSLLNSQYKASTPKTRKLIQARLKEGFTIDDFKVVNTKMTKAWGTDNKMRPYLRPETLYGTKFESYLNRPANLSMSTGAARTYAAGQAWLKKQKEKDNVE